MEMRLYERRTKTRLIDAWMSSEDVCLFCRCRNCVNTDDHLTLNVHGLIDDRGHPMMEQRVSCRQCGAEWTDVFCRMYPPCLDLPDTEEDGYGITL